MAIESEKRNTIPEDKDVRDGSSSERVHVENVVIEVQEVNVTQWEGPHPVFLHDQESRNDIPKKRRRDPDEDDDHPPSKRHCQNEGPLSLTISDARHQSLDNFEFSLSYEVESIPDVHLRNAILLRTNPRYILFSCLQSLTVSITALTSDTSNSGMPLNINLSRLRTRCREKSIKEGLMKTLVLKDEVTVTYLTEDVRILGDHPETYGSFADIWKGEWDEKGVLGGRNTRVVSDQ